MRQLSLQNRIALHFIISTTLLILVLCAVILTVSKMHLDELDTAHIRLDDVKHLFMVLLKVCCSSCLVILALLFVISRKIAHKSTQPIRKIISIANTITHNNLSARIPLPTHKDELYELSDTINNLLERMEYAVEREKSFTSYASHEFRTPLAVLKGTMEVLIRKPRTEAEYREKITACIREVDRLNDMVEQLLILTRYEEGKRSLKYDTYVLEELIDNSLSMFCDAILRKRLDVKVGIRPQGITIYTDEYSFSTILNNLVSNAVKYSYDEETIEIAARPEKPGLLMLEIRNTGKGIPPEDLDRIFEKFYRSYATTDQPEVKGFGLGLPIVKRFCTLLGFGIDIRCDNGHTTVVSLLIPLSQS